MRIGWPCPKFLLSGLCTLALTGSPATAATGTVSRSTHLSQSIDEIVEEGRRKLDLPGVSLAVMHGDQVIVAKGYGWADIAARTPASASTVYPIGSLSKQMTAAAVLALVNRRKIALDEPVETYLPEYRPPDGAQPTIRQLLQQTSGIPTWDDLPELQDESDLSKFQLPNVVDVLARHSAAYPAGYWWSYSNSNYTLLARMIERVSGMTYDRFLEQSLFAPLKLKSTSECKSRLGWPAGRNLATGYENAGGNFRPRPMRAASALAMAGAGGICSDALDLARWARMLVTGRAVGLPAYREMTRPTKVRAGFTAPYGFGVSLLPFAGQRAVWHTGVMAGYISVLVYLPDQDITVAALTNSRHVWLHSVVKNVAQAVMGIKAKAVRNLPIPDAEFERSVGAYDDYMFKFRVYRKGQQLFANIDQLGSPLRLRYQGGHNYATGDPQGFLFHFGPRTGAVKRVDWEWTELRAFARPVKH